MIRPHLSDIINNYKTFKNIKVHWSNEVLDYEPQFGLESSINNVN